MGPYLGEYQYDDDSSDWNNATLKDILNSETGTYYSALKTKNNKTLELISETNYYINGMDNSDVYTNILYRNERTGSSIWTGNIALLYPSDYGYAVDINNCSYTTSNYENCISYNWMYNLVTAEGSAEAWLLIAFPEVSGYGWNIYRNGNCFSFEYHGYSFFVSPVLYLRTELGIETEGDGSSSNPYRLVVN